MSNLIQRCYLDSDAILKIPISAYSHLCNFVLCWEYFKVKTCEGCDKVFCVHHKNHLCFKTSASEIEVK